jgi:hypothetical protein
MGGFVMHTRYLGFVCFVGFLFGAAGAARAADPPVLSPEQQVLDRFLGSWRTTYKVPKAEWTPEEKTGAADLTYSRVLGGQFVQERAEHADKTAGLVMYTYDVLGKTYRAWWFSSTGQTAEPTGKWDAGAKTLTWTSAASAGAEVTTTAHHRFVNDDAFEWDVVVKDSKGKVLFRMDGQAMRVKDSKK